jgi:hypothetical protein
MSTGLTIVNLSGQSAAWLTPKGTVKVRLGSVAWVEFLEVWQTWQGHVDLHTGNETPLLSYNVKWWERLALIIQLTGVNGQLEAAMARSAAGSIPDHVELKLTKLEALLLLEMWWAMPVEVARFGSLAAAVGDLHQLLS